MSVSLVELIEGVSSSRKYFRKHLDGLPEEAWTYKPYQECKSLLETLAHMRLNDLMAAESVISSKEPNYSSAAAPAMAEVSGGPDHLLSLLHYSHERLLTLIQTKFDNSHLEEEICIWGTMMPLFRGVPYLSSEDYYHAGQAAFIRMAVQPQWDYYASIYE